MEATEKPGRGVEHLVGPHLLRQRIVIDFPGHIGEDFSFLVVETENARHRDEGASFEMTKQGVDCWGPGAAGSTNGVTKPDDIGQIAT